MSKLRKFFESFHHHHKQVSNRNTREENIFFIPPLHFDCIFVKYKNLFEDFYKASCYYKLKMSAAKTKLHPLENYSAVTSTWLKTALHRCDVLYCTNIMYSCAVQYRCSVQLYITVQVLNQMIVIKSCKPHPPSGANNRGSPSNGHF